MAHRLGKAYLAGTDSGVATRTWQQALEAIIETKSGPTQDRWRQAAKQAALDLIRNRVILEMQGEHVLACLKAGIRLALPLAGCALDFNQPVSAPCRAHQKKDIFVRLTLLFKYVSRQYERLIMESIGNGITHPAIYEQLDRISRSKLFAKSARLIRFLKYTIENTVEGKVRELKESSVGREVYDRKHDYDPNQDSIVRTEALRLRSKLKEYYANDGKLDSIIIDFPSGSYVPTFALLKVSEAESDAKTSDELFSEGSGIPIGVIPFIDISNNPISAEFARSATDELVHVLMKTPGIRVSASNSMVQLASQVVDIPSLAKRLGVQILFEGSVRAEGNRVRVITRIVNTDGFQLWSQRFEMDVKPNELFKMAEQVVTTLISRTRPELTQIRKQKKSVSPNVLAFYHELLTVEELLDSGTIAEKQVAVEKFQEILLSAPNYARLYSRIARCYCDLGLSGPLDSYSLVVKARDAAKQAVEKDPGMIAAQGCAAYVSSLELRWEEAAAGFKHALSLGEDAVTARQYGLFLTATGNFEDAWYYLKKSQRIDPFSNSQKITCAKYFCISGRAVEAIQHFSDPLNREPLPVEARIYLARSHAAAGKKDEAKELTLDAQKEAAAESGLINLIAQNMAIYGDNLSAKKIAEDFNLLGEYSPISWYQQAVLLASLGNVADALKAISESVSRKEAELLWLGVEPQFKSLRINPSFTRIISKVKTYQVKA